MRVVGGSLRGRQLATPDPALSARVSLRPTSDRVRESVFNILAHGIDGFELEGCRVIDLFAGTGALGIEALSRGARYGLFVEENAEARAVVRRNIEAFGLTGVSKIWRRDAGNLGDAGNMPPYGLALLDPPYGKGLGERALESLARGGWLTPGAVAVVEERAGALWTTPTPYREVDRRTWGDTEVRFLVYQHS